MPLLHSVKYQDFWLMINVCSPLSSFNNSTWLQVGSATNTYCDYVSEVGNKTVTKWYDNGIILSLSTFVLLKNITVINPLGPPI